MPVTRVLITRDGRVIIEGIGYRGDECLVDLEKVERGLRALGVDINVLSHERKREEEQVELQEITTTD